ncbi:RpnC/YadD family protein [Glycomyces xiaoerkulensis]|uniref:hypothetical protein n=1 Tax=Glycomyces xiaoerkulensis TaxID=2038139 RepID=UPI000C267B85|nr:hypothetical protein [Glycomyces xiaoerkulensis]
MPGDAHELIAMAIRDEPRTAAWLLDLADLDRRAHVCNGAETRSESVGSPGPTERRADAVVRLSLPNESDRIVICEAQNSWKDEKYYRLPGYMTRAFEDHRIPVELVLICSEDSLAMRYRKGVYLGPGNTMMVHALGPSDFPDLIDPDSVPSVGGAVVVAAICKRPRTRAPESFISTLDQRLGTIEAGRAADYAKFLLTALAEAPARMLEELMQTKSRPYHSEYSDRLRTEGRQEGRQEGREEGAVEHARSVLLRMIETSSDRTAEAQRKRIEACDDLEQLDAWITEFLAKGSEASIFHP